ncbi:Hypothetical protein, predicted transmembrane protein [Mycoplasmopsis bovigenitalium 51080]|uniref:Uncharacterized protein n=1 Tax=Mycoplasmopsis bovigenitalium 51080 TaxID=1188235 RepID=N9TVN3_9BACT|nr:hypothetical protein [Mycoplasmopsis bovigenitalium]ENY70125.1 Hypothetical protein, predicted transmembrane protein [Mycoplasmopsis bovigenitalium 51080]
MVENKGLFNNIADKINDTKLSTKKVIDSIDNQNLDNLFELVVSSIQNSTLVDKEKLIEKFIQNKEEFKAKFRENISNYSKLIKNHIKNSKKEITYKIKQINSSIKDSKWKINDDGTISSKFLLSEYEKLNDHLSILKGAVVSVQEIITNLQSWKVACTTLGAASALTSTGLWIASLLFNPTLAIGAIAATAVSSGFVIASSIISNAIQYNVELIKNSNKLIKALYTKDNDLNIISFTTTAPTILGSIIKIYELVRDIDISPGLNTVGNLALSIANSIFKIKDLAVSIIELNHYKENVEKTSKIAEEFMERVKNIERIGWVVLNETPLSDYYYKGGIGGKNTHFKNLKTGEIKTLDEMLKYSNFELSSFGLQRVKHPKKGIYLRKIKNNILEDNLG